MATEKEIREELDEIGSVLARIPPTTPYSPPPEGYFEQLTATVVQQTRQAKRISISPQRAAWRMAAAAAVAGLLLLGGWLFMQNRSSGTADTFADVAILPMLQKNMQEVSDSEMINYVEGNDIVNPDEPSFSAPISDDDINLVFANVSDQELQQYLNQENISVKMN